MLTIEKYKGTRFWAVFRDGELFFSCRREVPVSGPSLCIRIEGNVEPGYVWAYFCMYTFSPSLNKCRYKYKLYTPDAVKAAIPKWISEYQDKKAIRQFQEVGLYEPPRIS